MTLPSKWTVRRLRDLATINYGRNPTAILDRDGEYPVYGTSGSERHGTGYLYDGESIILGRKGSIDRVHFADGRFWTIDTAYYLSDFNDTVPKWLYYFLCSIDLRALNEATGVPSLSRALLYNILTPTPPLGEQSRIAEVLSTIDRAIGQTEALIAKHQRIKTGLMQDLLTRGIDRYGNLRSEQTHKFKDSQLGRIPAEWDVTKIGDQFVERKEHGRPGLPVMSIVMNVGLVKRSLVDRRVETALSPKQHALVCEGDIAYNMMRMWQGVLGRASSDCLVSPAYVVLRPLESIDSRFAQWLFRDLRTIHAFCKASKGVVDDRLRLYPKDIFPILIAMPKCLDEHSLIADRLDAQHRAIEASVLGLEKLNVLKRGLMQDLLTGNRRVTTLLEPNGVTA